MESPRCPVQVHAVALLDAVDRAIGPWVVRLVERRLGDAGARGGAVASAARGAAADARAEVMPRLRALLEADIDEQATTPLAVLRSAVAHPTAVLREAGAPPVARDPDQQRRFPDDVYDLTPATFSELGPEVADAGLAWGAAKAFAHRQRHGGSP